MFSRAARLITVALTVCVVTLASIILVRDDTPPPIGCARGTLTVTGSTAFAPVVRELAQKYEKDCEGSTVTVDAHGSNAGIRELADRGRHGREVRLPRADRPLRRPQAGRLPAAAREPGRRLALPPGRQRPGARQEPLA